MYNGRVNFRSRVNAEVCKSCYQHYWNEGRSHSKSKKGESTCSKKRHIVEVRLAEKKAHQDAAQKSERKQKLLEVISRKQDQALEQMSVEDLTKLVNEI